VICYAADSGHVSAVCLLDLTAAFDTVGHDLLLLRLERQFGLRGVVLHWFQSHLSDRSFQVIYSNQRFTWCALFHKGPFQVRDFSFYTRQTSQTQYGSTM